MTDLGKEEKYPTSTGLKEDTIRLYLTNSIEGLPPRYEAEPPPEVIQVLNEQQLSQDKIRGWTAVPTLNPTKDRISTEDVEGKGLVDAFSLLEPLLDKTSLKGTLRTIDLLNGCGNQCDTCLADSALPTRMFSAKSLEKLFSDDRFIKMLQPDSLRFGSSGDILDHPQAIEIVKMVLDKTIPLDEKRISSGNDHHKIKIFVNYRPKVEQQLDELLRIAQENPDRIRIITSLPFNRKDTVNKAFAKYAKKRPEFGLKNVGIQDVSHPYVLFMTGRVLSKEANAGRVPEWDMVEVDRDAGFMNRGFAKTYLNPDALWLMIYATPYESHTGRVFTPINPDNLDALSHIPYHPDFPTPPNWSGGKGVEKGYSEKRRAKEEMQGSGKPMKNTNVIG